MRLRIFVLFLLKIFQCSVQREFLGWERGREDPGSHLHLPHSWHYLVQSCELYKPCLARHKPSLWTTNIWSQIWDDCTGLHWPPAQPRHIISIPAPPSLGIIRWRSWLHSLQDLLSTLLSSPLLILLTSTLRYIYTVFYGSAVYAVLTKFICTIYMYYLYLICTE